MYLRQYVLEDGAEMAQLFYDTVHEINKKDYTQEQLEVWAPKDRDIKTWSESFLYHNSLVAIIDDKIVGFADMDETGYLDRLYVHKDYQNQGVASKLCEWLENDCKEVIISVHASISAKSFFENRGYVTKKKQEVERKGIKLINYVMEKRKSGK